MITAQSKLAHAERLLRDVPPHRLRVLRQIAKREGRWQHVDWPVVDKGLAEAPAEPVLSAECREPIGPLGGLCPQCRPRTPSASPQGRAVRKHRKGNIAEIAAGSKVAHVRRDGGDTTKATIRNYLSARPNAPFCSRCEARVPNCGPDAVSVLCWRCTSELATHQKHVPVVGRKCPECGGPIGPHKRFCPACVKARRRKSERERQRRSRRTQLSAKLVCKSL